MSVLNKKWLVKNTNNNLSVPEKLLANRGLVEERQIQAFLNPDYQKGFYDPFLMKDMTRAVQRIKKAIDSHERIIIFGDYDVDGISGTAILCQTLKACGANVSYRLPHRVKDGYGLSDAFVEDFARAKATLVITVDCGISCKRQIELAKKHGIDVVITDHHTVPENFPDAAYAILHPLQPHCAYPFKGLTGAGVAYKLASALIADQFSIEEREKFLFSLLDLASLGTVADIGPVQDENRIIIKYGLEALKNTRWSGLRFLKENAGIGPDQKIDAHTIGFRIGPRINAAGRIDHPYYALQLLLNNEDDAKGKRLANHLEKLNKIRQQMVIKALEEAENQYLLRQPAQKIFIAWSADWHVGILGLIAGRIAEKYSVPCIILQDFGEYLVASARSPENFNVVEAITLHGQYLEHFGGHAQAAGLNIKKENLAKFVEAMTAYANEKLAHAAQKPVINIDCELEEVELNENLMKFLDQMEPFGPANAQPLFLIKNVRHAFAKRVGREQNHLSFQAHLNRSGNNKMSAIAYSFGEHKSVLEQHETLDIVCSLERNEWNGRSQLQLRIMDLDGHV